MNWYTIMALELQQLEIRCLSECTTCCAFPMFVGGFNPKMWLEGRRAMQGSRPLRFWVYDLDDIEDADADGEGSPEGELRRFRGTLEGHMEQADQMGILEAKTQPRLLQFEWNRLAFG